jgi:hypothetical protein
MQAWQAYDRLFEDDRVAMAREPEGLDVEFRKFSSLRSASPKAWAGAYFAAFANR